MVVGYGAAAKGNTLLNFSGIKPDLLPFVCDLAPSKQNKFLPTTAIPIVDTNTISTIKPEVIILFAWNFKDDIIKNLRKKYKKSIDIIIPLPNPRKIKI